MHSLVTPLQGLTNVMPWEHFSIQDGGSRCTHHYLGVRPPSDKAGRCWPGRPCVSQDYSICWRCFSCWRESVRPVARRTPDRGADDWGRYSQSAAPCQGGATLCHTTCVTLAVYDWCIRSLCYRLILSGTPALIASRSLYGDFSMALFKRRYVWRLVCCYAVIFGHRGANGVRITTSKPMLMVPPPMAGGTTGATTDNGPSSVDAVSPVMR